MGELALAFAFFVVWGLAGAAIELSLGKVPGVRLLGSLGLWIGLAIAIVFVAWANCLLFVELPFTVLGCRVLGF
jgi:hypothetical protein